MEDNFSLDYLSSKEYSELSENEKQAVVEILNDVSKNNSDDLYDQLYYQDYDEIPVDFETFISDDRYLGKTTRHGEFLYQFWHEESKKIFARTDINEVALTGCLSGDTLIPLINGANVSIRELSDSGIKNFKVYSYNLETNRFTVGNATRAFCTGYKPVYKVTFDNGESIKITGNHKFLKRDKHYQSIDEGLSVGDSIMPFNRDENSRGYEIIKHPQKDGTFIEEPTHRMVMGYKVGIPFKGCVHHKNCNKKDNSPENLILMTWTYHKHFHAVRGGDRWRSYMKNLRNELSPEEFHNKFSEQGRKAGNCRWSKPEAHVKASQFMSKRNIGNKYGCNISDENREKKRERRIYYNKYEHPGVKHLLEINKDEFLEVLSQSLTPKKVIDTFNISFTGYLSLVKRFEIDPKDYLVKTPFNLPNKGYSKFLNIYNRLLNEYGDLTDDIVREHGFNGLPLITKLVNNKFNGDKDKFIEIVKLYNHKIVSIELCGTEQVYDIEVEKYHNFALCAGIVVHNSIGTGKSTSACLMMAYHLYKTMCLRDPQAFFKLSPGSKITYAFLNNTLDSSSAVGYDTIQSFLKESPWFLEHGTLHGRGEQEYLPGKGFKFIIGSKPQHTLGQHIIAAMIDEVSFSSGQDINYVKSNVMKIYRNIKRRMESRFTVGGKFYGLMFLVSSKSSESAFLEQYIADQIKKGYPIYVVDKPVWEVKPDAFGKERFRVAVGNKYLPSRIIRGHDEAADLECEGYKKQGLNIIDVPIELIQAFDQDIDTALQDHAGISTSVKVKAFDLLRIQKCVSKYLRNPFTTEVVSTGINDDLQLKDFFDASLVPEEVLGAPVFIHLDASLTGDRTGLSAVAIIGTKQKQLASDIEDEDGEVIISEELLCQQVFTVGIQAPSNSEISFEKTRQFIYYLKDELGFNIKKVTTDGFQSADVRQILYTKGFDVGYTSLDRTPDGYDSLKSGINDRRIILLQGCDELINELTDLERDNTSRRYDHPLSGRKDESDSLGGAYYDALQYKDEYMFWSQSDIDYEGLNDNTDYQTQYVENLRKDIISATTNPKQSVNKDKDVDYNIFASASSNVLWS